MEAHKKAFAIFGVCLLVTCFSALALRENNLMLELCVAPYVRGARYDSMENYMIRELEKSEAREVAKFGHQTYLNWEAAKALDVGDVVEWPHGEIRIVVSTSNSAVFIRKICNSGLDYADLYLNRATQFTPDKFNGVWKRGTPKWKEIVITSVLEQIVARRQSAVSTVATTN